MAANLSILICHAPIPVWLEQQLQPLFASKVLNMQSQPPEQGLYLIYDDAGLGWLKRQRKVLCGLILCRENYVTDAYLVGEN